MIIINHLNFTITDNNQASTEIVKVLDKNNVIINFNNLTQLLTYNLSYDFNIRDLKKYRYYQLIINKQIKSKLLKIDSDHISDIFSFDNQTDFNMYSFQIKIYDKTKNRIDKTSLSNFTSHEIVVPEIRFVYEQRVQFINSFNN